MKNKQLLILAFILIGLSASVLFLKSPLPLFRGGDTEGVGGFFSLFSPLWKRGGGGDLSASAAAPREGLVGWWTMDTNDMSATGATLYDKSGQNNNGTVTGTTTSTGRIGQARSFNGGTVDKIVTPIMNISASGGTVSLWFKANVLGNIMMSLSGTNNTYIYQSSATNIAVQTDVVTTVKNFTVPTMSTGIWYHLAVTRNSNTTRVYLNGIESTSGGQAQTDVMNFNQIGKYGESASLWWNGSIDDVRVYNRALSAAEVAQLYSSAKTSYANTPVRASSTPTTSGRLVGYWTMDANDINGTTVYDKSGQGNNGTSANTPTKVAGKIGQAMSFNGSTDKVTFPAISLGTVQTCVAWVKLAVADTDAAIIGYANDNSNYCMYFNGGSIWFNPGVSAGSWVYPLNDNKWHHVIISRNTAFVTAYVDGVSLGEVGTGSGALTVHYIGQTGLGAGYPFTGSLDDVRVYNYALSAQEIANLYQSSARNYAAVPPREGLVGYWTMDANDINGTNYYDKSGNNNTATSTGSPTITAGKINQAGNFSNSYVGIPDQSYLRGTQQTFSMWVRPTATPAVFGGVLAHANSQEGYNFLFNASNQVVFYRRTVASAWVTVASAALPLNQWTHITGTVNGNTIQIFTNGVAGNSDSTASATLFVNSDYRIGDYMSTYKFTGSIDDVRVYNRALSPSEVSQLYESARRSYIQ